MKKKKQTENRIETKNKMKIKTSFTSNVTE